MKNHPEFTYEETVQEDVLSLKLHMILMHRKAQHYNEIVLFLARIG